MIYSILNDCLLLRNEPEQSLKDYFKKTGITIFEPIFLKHKSESKHIILFILCGYSEDSPLLILRQDSTEEKRAICEYLEIPDYKRKALYELSDPTTRQAVTQYLAKFAGPLFKILSFLKIQYTDLELDITNRAFIISKTTKGKEGEEDIITEVVDAKEQAKARTDLLHLARNIDAIERQIRQQIKRMEGIEDLQHFSREGKTSGKIKGQRQGNVEASIK